MRNSFMMAAAAAMASLSGAAQAYVTVHVETSRTAQAQIAAGAHVEDFSGAAATPSLVSGFGGSGVSGTFSGVGLDAAGSFAVVTDSATLKLDRMVKYFGYRAGELDGNTTVELFSDGTSLGFFNLVDSPERAGAVSLALGSAMANMLSGGAPSAGVSSDFTFVNFISDIAFNEVRFTQSAGSFKFDDVSINTINAVPEPATWGMMIMGFGAAGAALRRRTKGVRFA